MPTCSCREPRSAMALATTDETRPAHAYGRPAAGASSRLDKMANIEALAPPL